MESSTAWRERPATLADADALVELVDMAGEGLPMYLWEGMAERGQSAREIGRARALREEGAFSYRNATVLERAGEVAACLIGYPLPDVPEPVDHAGVPPVFVPLQQLEDLAPATWYVNVLATYPARRGQGLASVLLTSAERQARAAGKAGLSIIVADANAGARRLYERHGYVEVASRPMVKERWRNPSSSWVLLTRALESL